jgi:hypothetical protein
MQDYEQRQFMIFSVTELNKIDFNEVLETSEETVRKSIDETLTFVKWDSEGIPNSVQTLTTTQGPYTYSEMLEILKTPVWYQDLPLTN